MQPRTVLLLTAVLAFSAAVPCSAGERPPNVVLIMADDMGYECVRANGGTSYQTPHLDALAESGLRFTNCHSQPICTPSRVQIMTGIYNNRNYVRFGLLDTKATTFAQLLKQAGYATCIGGKWQLSGGADAPQHFGFDEHCLWQLTRRPGRYPNPGLEVNGREIDYTSGEYGPDLVSDFLCDFMQRHRDRPFLVYYPMILPHWPFEPTPDSDDWDPRAKGVLKGVGEAKYFDDMVAYTDKMVGKLVARLDTLGLRENTVVLFTGDNGTYKGIRSVLNGREMAGGKGSTIDAGTHVPLIGAGQGVPRGQVCADLIDFSDFLPTLLDLAGVALPESIRFDGRSFGPQLRGEPGSPRKWVYCWYHRDGKRNRATQHVRTVRHKLYASGRFFDVLDDPLEQRPLDRAALTPEVAAVYRQLVVALAERVDETEAETKRRRAAKVKKED